MFAHKRGVTGDLRRVRAHGGERRAESGGKGRIVSETLVCDVRLL